MAQLLLAPRHAAGNHGAKWMTQIVVVGCVCVGTALLFSGMGCATGATLCPIISHTSQPQLQSSLSAATVLVNSKTGQHLALGEPRAPAPRASAVDAKQAIISGLLSVAALNNAAGATEQVVEEWNKDFGAQYGTFELLDDRRTAAPTDRREAGATMKLAQAPLLAMRTRAMPPANPIEQVVAEWNKDFAAQYGSWDIVPPQPLATAAQMPNTVDKAPEVPQATMEAPIRAAAAVPIAPPVMDYTQSILQTQPSGGLMRMVIAAVTFIVAGIGLLLAAFRLRRAQPQPQLVMVNSDASASRASSRVYLAMAPAATSAVAPEPEAPVRAAAPAETAVLMPETVAMTGAEGQKEESVQQMDVAVGEYMFTCGEDGQMQLQYFRSTS